MVESAFNINSMALLAAISIEGPTSVYVSLEKVHRNENFTCHPLFSLNTPTITASAGTTSLPSAT